MRRRGLGLVGNKHVLCRLFILWRQFYDSNPRFAGVMLITQHVLSQIKILRTHPTASPNPSTMVHMPASTSHLSLLCKPTMLNNSQPTADLHAAPTATKNPARTNPQSMSISSAAMLFAITAQLTALAALGRSYSHTISNIGNNFVHELTISAVLSGVGRGW